MDPIQTTEPRRYFGTFQKFLLVLIVIGIILIATQKLWVPKLVNSIIATQQKPQAK